MTQVHKETLTTVENALPNRSNLDVEIFGMEGIPEDVIQAHRQRVLGQIQQAEAERTAATGNPAPGAGAAGSTKKPKFESPSELKKRLAEHKAKMAEQAAGGSSGSVTPMGAGQSLQSPSLGPNAVPYVSQCPLRPLRPLVADNFFCSRLPAPRRITSNLNTLVSPAMALIPATHNLTISRPIRRSSQHLPISSYNSQLNSKVSNRQV